MGRRTKVLITVAFVTLLVHGFGLRNQFAGDDRRAIVAHPAVSGGESLSALLTLDSAGLEVGKNGTLFRPVTTATYRLDWWLGDGSPLPFHISNIVLFFVTCCLIYHFARRWLTDSAAFATVVIFAAMPIHVEVVANATGRSEILSLLFGLLALELARPREEPQASGEGGGGREVSVGRYLLFGLGAAAFYGASVLSKESGFFFPCIALWLTFCSGPTSRRAYLPVLLMGAVACAFLVFRFTLLSSTAELAESGMYLLNYRNPLAGDDVSLLARIWTCCEVLGRYVVLSLAPYELPHDYSYAAVLPHTDPTHPLSLLGAAVILAIVVGLFWGLRRRNRCSAFLGGFAGSYILISNLFLLIGTIQGNRLFFGSSLWLALLIGLAFERLELRIGKLVLVFASAALLVGYGWAGVDASRCWYDDWSRASCAVESQPNSIYSQLWLGYVYGRSGKPWEALWYTAVHYDGFRSYPQPWTPPEGVDDLSAEERVLRMTELLGRDRAWLLELEYYIRNQLDSEPLAQFLRDILIEQVPTSHAAETPLENPADPR